MADLLVATRSHYKADVAFYSPPKSKNIFWRSCATVRISTRISNIMPKTDTYRESRRFSEYFAYKEKLIWSRGLVAIGGSKIIQKIDFSNFVRQWLRWFSIRKTQKMRLQKCHKSSPTFIFVTLFVLLIFFGGPQKPWFFTFFGRSGPLWALLGPKREFS